MGLPSKFTYPFAYSPHPLVREAAELLIARVQSDPSLDALFREGKMLGVLLASDGSGTVVLNGFSGLAGGRSMIDGFVPPIFDLTDPQGHFKRREAEISAMPEGAEKSAASRELQKWIFTQFKVFNAKGECRSILDIFADMGIVPPGGTGECALPKMLQYAYRNGLRPLAFGEFWYGASPTGEVRSAGCFYPSCTGKCGPLLGFMLQGLDVEANPMQTATAGTYRILYEDGTLIVAEKPSGMLSVPGKIKADSLLALLQRRENARRGGMPAVGGRTEAACCDEPAVGSGEKVTIYSCHRLDMDTSGLMVFAKTPQAQADIQQQFENRIVEKTYLARLAAVPASPLEVGGCGTVDLPLALDWYDRPRQMVDAASGKPAQTEYEVLQVHDGSSGDLFGTAAAGEVLVRFTPLTGRTHQLRVHSAHPSGLGRPICGDRLYGGVAGAAGAGAEADTITGAGSAEKSPVSDGYPQRLCLHAATLSFRHPLTGETLSFESLQLR